MSDAIAVLAGLQRTVEALQRRVNRLEANTPRHRIPPRPDDLTAALMRMHAEITREEDTDTAAILGWLNTPNKRTGRAATRPVRNP